MKKFILCLTILSSVIFNSLILYTTLGTKVKTIVFNTNKVIHAFSVKDLKPGIYFYEFVNNNEIKSGKVIIEK